MSDSDNTPSKPNNAKSIALHGTGLLLSTLAAAAAAHAIDLGQLLQNHPKTTMSIAGAGGTILYAWASWTHHLRKLCSEPSTRGLGFDEGGGFYVEPKTGIAICTRCLNDSPRRYVPMMDVSGAKICNACDKCYAQNHSSRRVTKA
jgi:hypothetical protein